MSYPAAELYYRRFGSGSPTILLHGVPATNTLWRPLAEPLSASRAAFVPDLPGFGRSPRPSRVEEFALPELARLVLAFASLHGMEWFDLIGHSFGGALSTTIADIAPERLRSLTLICPVADIPPPATRVFRSSIGSALLPGLWRITPGFLRRAIARNGARINYGKAYTDERADELGNELNRPDLARTMADILGAIQFEEYGERIDRVAANTRLPLLLIGGRQDRIVPFDHFERMRGRMSRARAVVFDEGSHMVMWQYPGELREVIEGFWNDIG